MASKEKKRNILIGIVLVVFLFIMAQNQGFFPFSLATFSITNVDVIEQGERILIFARIGGGDEYVIDFGPDNLNSFLRPEGLAASSESTLRAEFLRSNKEFRFFTSSAASNRVTSINGVPSGSITTIFGGNIQRCKNAGFPNTVAVVQRPFTITYDCYETMVFGTMNDFTGGESGGFEIEFSLDGESEILRQNFQRITLAGGDAVITWQGNMLDINNVNPPNAKVYHIGNSWTLVEGSGLSSIQSGLSNFRNCVGTSSTSPSTFGFCFNNYEQTLFQGTESINQEYINIESNVDNIDFSSGVMDVILGQPTFIPTVTINLDADRVSIRELQGEPDIISCIEPQVFTTAGSRFASATIKNIGEEEGFFDFEVQCNNPLMSGQANSLDFRAGQTRTVNFQLVGGNTGSSTNQATCSLTVTDRNSPNLDSCQFGFDVEFEPAIGQCLTGDTQCSPDGTTLFVCQNNVFQPSLCGQGLVCTFVAGTHQCVVDPNPQEPGFFDKIKDFFRNLFSGTFSALKTIKLVIVLGLGVISVFVTQDVLTGIKGLKKNKTARWILAVGVGLGVGFALNSFIGSVLFWVFSILALFYFFFSSQIKAAIRR